MDTPLDHALTVFHCTAAQYGPYYSNHGPMAAEALEALGLEHRISDFVGDYQARLEPRDGGPPPLQERIEREGVGTVVREVLPSLLLGVSGHLFHGLIRTGHALRGYRRHPTPTRAREVAHALAYWTSVQPEGKEDSSTTPATERPARDIVLAAARAAARAYLGPARGRDQFILLHTVTASAAVYHLLDWLADADAHRIAGALVEATAAAGVDHGSRSELGDSGPEPFPDNELARRAGESLDAHDIKFADACILFARETGDDVFRRAASAALA